MATRSQRLAPSDDCKLESRSNSIGTSVMRGESSFRNSECDQGAPICRVFLFRSVLCCDSCPGSDSALFADQNDTRRVRHPRLRPLTSFFRADAFSDDTDLLRGPGSFSCVPGIGASSNSPHLSSPSPCISGSESSKRYGF